MSDLTNTLIEQVKEAASSARALRIEGADTKRFLGREIQGERLSLAEHRGIMSYQPVELVLTARAGTPLVEIKSALAEHNQVLSFDPPTFEGRATLGGTLAANLSGPSRPWSGSVRDMVLGVKLINGRGELLNFGGQVMKNVAGYDVSRAQAGAMGTLGVMTQISLKVMPKPEVTRSLVLDIAEGEAITLMNQLAATPKPIVAAS
ncbi:MAG: glycolate oxidase subunit GlcE, partial [Pseudomonadales bacterium]